MYKEIFHQKLKKARENTGFTQREVSKETNISQPSIAQYESGTREPDIETLGILADFYNVSLDWLIGTGITKKETAKITTDKNKKAI